MMNDERNEAGARAPAPALGCREKPIAIAEPSVVVPPGKLTRASRLLERFLTEVQSFDWSRLALRAAGIVVVCDHWQRRGLGV